MLSVKLVQFGILPLAGKTQETQKVWIRSLRIKTNPSGMNSLEFTETELRREGCQLEPNEPLRKSRGRSLIKPWVRGSITAPLKTFTHSEL